jgi:hypothetical protein
MNQILHLIDEADFKPILKSTCFFFVIQMYNLYRPTDECYTEQTIGYCLDITPE